eukprot:TRINITY_DN2384_c1_g1_i1.p2 TRINITY_DN2384_c1_g1~~TRINITY_DN2384_c1_g1_i1.p2  ORF type:complete len:120 (-),score=21.94 TRINITY_DN2384_c1_g1_i1:322-681(-)
MHTHLPLVLRAKARKANPFTLPTDSLSPLRRDSVRSCRTATAPLSPERRSSTTGRATTPLVKRTSSPSRSSSGSSSSSDELLEVQKALEALKGKIDSLSEGPVRDFFVREHERLRSESS